MPRLLTTATLAIALVATAAACTSSSPTRAPASIAPAPPTAGPSVAVASQSVAPTSVAPSIAAPSAAPSAAASGSTSASPSGLPAVTTIDWGDIWDALPASFPVYPGSRPTVTGGDPASAIMDVPADPSTASTWFQAGLRLAGFAIVGANGPREDGSFDIVATKGSADCQTEISLAPLGAITTATIYFGAACPFA